MSARINRTDVNAAIAAAALFAAALKLRLESNPNTADAVAHYARLDFAGLAAGRVITADQLRELVKRRLQTEAWFADDRVGDENYSAHAQGAYGDLAEALERLIAAIEFAAARRWRQALRAAESVLRVELDRPLDDGDIEWARAVLLPMAAPAV